MFPFFRLWFGLLARCFRSHHSCSWRTLDKLFLGARASVLVRLEEFSHPRHSRNCGAPASYRISAVLELDLEGEKTGRQKKTGEGNPESDLPDGGRKPNLPERAPPQAASRRIHVLLSRRPHPSRPPQGNSWPQNPYCNHRSGDLTCAIGWFAPSLRPRGLRSADSHWLTPLATSVTSSPSNKDP
jgi:hypothetical protein